MGSGGNLKQLNESSTAEEHVESDSLQIEARVDEKRRRMRVNKGETGTDPCALSVYFQSNV